MHIFLWKYVNIYFHTQQLAAHIHTFVSFSCEYFLSHPTTMYDFVTFRLIVGNIAVSIIIVVTANSSSDWPFNVTFAYNPNSPSLRLGAENSCGFEYPLPVDVDFTTLTQYSIFFLLQLVWVLLFVLSFFVGFFINLVVLSVFYV